MVGKSMVLTVSDNSQQQSDSLTPGQICAPGGGDNCSSGTVRASQSPTAAGSVLFSLGGQAVKVATQVGGTLVLARLLQPSAYGSFSLAFCVVSFAQLFKDGFALAAIQKAELTDEESSTLFWINCSTGALVCLLMSLAAPVIARIYHAPVLASITFALAVSVLISYVSNHHLALLRRQMRFSTVAVIDQFAAVIAMISGIVAALAGWQIWSLVMMQATLVACTACGVLSSYRWHPVRIRWQSTVELLRYGREVICSDIATYVTRNFDNLLIGWSCGMTQLGLYDRAYNIMQMPMVNMLVPTANVAHSALSREQSNQTKFARLSRNFATATTAMGMFGSSYLFVHCDRLVPLILGNSWLGVIPVMHALTPAAFIDAGIMTVCMLLLASGSTKAYFKLKLFAAVLALGAFFLGVRWGTVGVAVAFSVSRLCAFVYGWYLARAASLDASGVMRDSLALPMVSSLFAATLALCLQPIMPHSLLLGLAASTVSFCFAWASIWLMFASGRQKICALIQHGSRAS
jgi:O-antigen/teichoic acid export membrane protein